MARYRKTTLTEAYQYVEGYLEGAAPPEFIAAVCREEHHDSKDHPHIHTLEGLHYITRGDWIARGVKGEFWPIKPDVFLASYEVVDEGS